MASGYLGRLFTYKTMRPCQAATKGVPLPTGTGKEPVFKKHHDLDALAGGWSKEEVKAFQKNTKIFERIDEDLWK